MPSRRKGSSNPTYHDDPDWYERPGETVLLDYKPQPGMIAIPALPWRNEGMGERADIKRRTRSALHQAGMYDTRCEVCGKRSMVRNTLCPACARCQQRYEHNQAQRGGSS